jgi:L-fuconolactonase
MWPEHKDGDRIAEPDGFPLPRELDARVEMLIARMDAHGVSRAIVVQTPWHHHDDAYVLEQAQHFPGRLTPVASFPLMLQEADIAHEAGRLGKGGLSGVRLHVVGPNSLAIFQSDAIDPLYARAAETGAPVLFLTRNYMAFETYDRVAAAFPAMRMVIEHMGHVTAPFGGAAADLDALMRLSRRPNIHVKLGLHHQHSLEDYPWADLVPLQRRFIAEFGPQRLMWGSNWPMRLPDPTYTERLEVMSRHFPFSSDEERDWIMGGTAESLWPSPVAAAPSARTAR